MAGVSRVSGVGAYQAYNAGQDEERRRSQSRKDDSTAKHNLGEGGSVSQKAQVWESDYGKTVGEPKLSEEGQKYYEQLKKKFGNYDFVLVSSAEKENAKANASRYANGFKTVVLIDEEKIEKMAVDKDYRKQYEDILSGAAAQMQQLQAGLGSSGANVKGYGMQVNDNGTVSFFAVLKKSSAEQRARIQKRAELKKAERKAADKKEAKKAQEERIAARREKKAEIPEEEDTLLTADSLEDLLRKIGEYSFEERSNQVQTEEEKLVGQSIDFRG